MDKKTNSMYTMNMIGCLFLIYLCIINKLFILLIVPVAIFIASLFVKNAYKNKDNKY